MKEQNIELIRKACIKANPEVMQLKFGTNILIPQNSGEKYCYRVCDVMESNAYLQVKAPWEGIQLNKESVKIVLARNCAITDDTLERYAVKDIEILGRPIRLADILNALSAHVPNGMNGKSIMVGEYGAFYEEMKDYNHRCAATWNLLKDSLTEQDEPTLSFIAALLTQE